MGNYGTKDGEANGEHTVIPDAIPPRVTQANSPAYDDQSRKMALASSNGQGKSSDVVEIISSQHDDFENIVPTVFRWEHGGRNVYITGTFNNWEKQIPMHRSGNDFSYVHNLRRGKHAYKFIVDDEWRFAPDQPTVPDIEGRINNYIDVSEFQPYMGDDKFFEKSKECKVIEAEFHQSIPELEEYTKDPPVLPPHLRHIILNKPPVSSDPLSLPIPQHVALHHLYCTAIKDNMMVLGATQRYREKYVTFVFYSAVPPNTQWPSSTKSA